MSARTDHAVRVITNSGLWASFGDAAKVIGTAPRALANDMWDSDCVLARADGTVESEDAEKEARWVESHPEAVRRDAAFGYRMGRPRPQELRLTPSEIRMLLGEMECTAALRIRLNDQLDHLLLEADRGEDEVVWNAVDELRALLKRMYESS